MSSTPQWSFTNSLGRVITTGDAGTAEKYRQSAGFSEVTDTPSVEHIADDGHVQPYSEWLVEDLKNEIEARNDAAGDEDPVIDATGNKKALVAALEAHDAAVRGAQDSSTPGQNA